ncbi:hypothetical protein ACFUIZ_18945 [Streptomyces cinereoruber]|uniref:hypothetical protein n=1 Tax=Streptomyces cinereoruber TaxID=67260 RepID=UPI00363902E1
MGWGSGYRVFNDTANALIKAGATDEMKEAVLTDVIRALHEQDWDTELDSLQDYLDDPAIVRAFAAHGIRWDDDE